MDYWRHNFHPSSKSYVHVDVKWNRPPLGWVKFNFDGYVHNNSATIGFIIGNSDGHALLARAKKIGEVTITVAECLALRDGLAYMVHNGWGKVLVEGDSKIVIDCMD
ncbi:hypothetical protein PRUPE_3G103800 [Prunus persica]|uniref:RNase H type-1 domain-containing protein n=1 Tax=Prunus persica TaxID=3760 RepID=A0A251PYC2_PRUPE|nr:hypothetical protein PRUPE_3G103800 [Prunus persica]